MIINRLYINGAPGEIRTPDQSVRSRLLYPAELRALNSKYHKVVNNNVITSLFVQLTTERS